MALGSSYASGPEGSLTDRRCGRSDDNYPHQVAGLLRMNLVDVSCSGATTTDILQRAQPGAADAPQIDAVTVDTALVTLTVGGNNIDYMRRAMAWSCAAAGAVPNTRRCDPLAPPLPTADDLEALSDSLTRVVTEISDRAPNATVVVVDYPPLAVRGDFGCAALPLTYEQIAEVSVVLDHITEALADAASQVDAHVVEASRAGRAHGVCSPQPWLYGYHGPSPYHQNPEGKSAIARLVAETVGRAG
ncbi:SGNH/GDSL hydrolase family protein [Gordonia desulfuricans]|uniref:SGNH/GDSL hydrolase family protein n=1 Tax=Gordonia desulfuricans TaxID=89051 RepID=A0A7K3LJF1_9ACTN|nr:SGNH/GDSL hydrolase family protein [Gordonia desulfuricans]NDK88191.1 SGNH/GDSL hydrolase family protein [Gordonia desulfuricans]